MLDRLVITAEGQSQKMISIPGRRHPTGDWKIIEARATGIGNARTNRDATIDGATARLDKETSE